MVKVKIRKMSDYTHRDKIRQGKVRSFPIISGLPTPDDLTDELQEMLDVLLGRTPAPIDSGVTTMMEVADAYYARAAELTFLIHQGERSGSITKNSEYYKLRTGELRIFMDACKRSVETGSRRLSAEQMRFNQQERGLDSEGYGGDAV